jgi:hypothetical protein
VFLVLYAVPMNLFSLTTTGFRAEQIEKSYYTNNLCDDGTSFPCPPTFIGQPGS